MKTTRKATKATAKKPATKPRIKRTELTVTLKDLRKAGACRDGYNRVVCMLKGVEYEYRATYMRYKHDEPINVLSILQSNGLDDIFWVFDHLLATHPVMKTLARQFALSVIHLWKATPIVKRYLETGDESIRLKACRICYRYTGHGHYANIAAYGACLENPCAVTTARRALMASDSIGTSERTQIAIIKRFLK